MKQEIFRKKVEKCADWIKSNGRKPIETKKDKTEYYFALFLRNLKVRYSKGQLTYQVQILKDFELDFIFRDVVISDRRTYIAQNDIRHVLQKHKDLLNLEGFGRKIGTGRANFANWCNGEKSLSKEKQEKLIEILTELVKDIEGFL